jgi:hypothetical protein
MCDEIAMNDTVKACPINVNKKQAETIVAVYFPR